QEGTVGAVGDVNELPVTLHAARDIARRAGSTAAPEDAVAGIEALLADAGGIPARVPQSVAPLPVGTGNALVVADGAAFTVRPAANIGAVRPQNLAGLGVARTTEHVDGLGDGGLGADPGGGEGCRGKPDVVDGADVARRIQISLF